jgi:pimeloyl-ACP methyl ester carboxylesterase
MAYWQWGDPANDHVVLCAHGLSRQGRDFDVLAQDLSRRVRVVCPDVVGRGQSDWLKDPAAYQIPHYAADMLVLLAQLKPATLDWVGTSMGGLIGMVLCGQPGLSGAGPSQGAKAPSGGSAAREAASVGVQSLFPVPVRRLVLNDVGPGIQWQALQRIGTYLGQTGRFESLQQAADAMWAISTGFGPHTAAQWLALSRHMVKPLADGSGAFTLHYDPAIAVPFRTVTPESAAQGEAALWQLYDNIKARTLLTRGALSDLLSSATALAMTQRGPRAQLIEFEGVGHAPTLIARPQREAITSFLLD